ncbi:SIR2 family protein [Acinetobacter sp. ANC 3781]|uniref:SIR2 family protein n=1 Tax=Acinetobacter sp. ANC 3781 TaxID=2529835 RepID=UPI001039F183|nr:SIR2 family protein [Acinetobacter sp. ANC 3781]TCB78370.1 SIR2 family protein [Acinetobacter sp. ANC 3781]
MDIFDFINKYENHPVLFLGTGFSLRYLKNSYSWENLLKAIAFEIKGDNEYFHDLKGQVYDRKTDKYDFMKLASLLQKEFNKVASTTENRNGKFKDINDEYYKKADEGISSDKFKIYISYLLKDLKLKEAKEEEIEIIKQLSKNISSIITTNYDQLIEHITQFDALVGNNILLSNPYGSVYKIHGSIEEPEGLVFTTEDYDDFDDRYDLIRAQLISIFVHNPIIFIGYSVNDINIKKILSTIYKYVQLNSREADRIRNNFLLVEYTEGSDSLDVLDHDIDVDGNTIRINKIKTDNYIDIYKAIEGLSLPVTAYQVKRVLDTVKEITSGGSIKVSIAEDIDDLKNSEKILAISPVTKTKIEYTYKEPSQLIEDYFDILHKKDESLIKLIDDMKISKSHWFPIYGFSSIYNGLSKLTVLQQQQDRKIEELLRSINCTKYLTLGFATIEDVLKTDIVAESYKIECIFCLIYNDKITLDDLEHYLQSFNSNRELNFKKLLCLYDQKKYK